MSEEIPQWAKERAVSIANAEAGFEAWSGVESSFGMCAFARYIAEHEEPPVDPVKAATADAFRVIWDENKYATCEAWSERMHAELEKRGLKIVPADDGIELGRASK